MTMIRTLSIFAALKLFFTFTSAFAADNLEAKARAKAAAEKAKESAAAKDKKSDKK